MEPAASDIRHPGALTRHCDAPTTDFTASPNPLSDTLTSGILTPLPRNAGIFNPSFRRKPESVVAGSITVSPDYDARFRHPYPGIPTPPIPSFRRKPESVAAGAITVSPDYDARFRLAPE